MNYFELLGIDPAFTIDAKALENDYFIQQRLYHPDRYVKKTPAERQQALLRSVDINAAYETLKKPQSRAQYLLHLQGIEVGTESDTVKPSRTLLMQTLQWREAIDEAATADALTQLEESLNAATMHTIDAIATYYESHDWSLMAQDALRLSYILKTREAITIRRPKVKS